MHPTTFHFHGGDILLRPFDANDVAALHAAVRGSIESLSYWLPWCRPDYSRADAETWVSHCIRSWEAGSEFPLGIFDNRSGGILGSVGLSRINRIDRVANLGYWVGERHRGNGIATRAVMLAASMGFEQLGFARLEIVVLPHNIASQRVAEKVGATREAEARNRLVFQGRPATAIVYSLAPGDVATRNPAG